jgi:hypothetical protein
MNELVFFYGGDRPGPGRHGEEGLEHVGVVEGVVVRAHEDEREG